MKWTAADYCLLGLIALFFTTVFWFEDIIRWL